MPASEQVSGNTKTNLSEAMRAECDNLAKKCNANEAENLSPLVFTKS
jgi:hypothetical protein